METEEQPELGATDERPIGRLEEEGPEGMKLTRNCWMMELVSCGLMQRIKRRVGQSRWGRLEDGAAAGVGNIDGACSDHAVDYTSVRASNSYTVGGASSKTGRLDDKGPTPMHIAREK